MPTAELSKFKFLGYRLDSLHFEHQEGASEDGNYRLNIQFETNVDLVEEGPEEPDDVDHAAETTSALVCSLVSLRLWVEWEPSPGPFSFEMGLQGRFERHAEMPADAFKQFSTISGPAVLFTHARPLVRNVMIEAGERFRLPLLNIRDSLRNLESELGD